MFILLNVWSLDCVCIIFIIIVTSERIKIIFINIVLHSKRRMRKNVTVQAKKKSEIKNKQIIYVVNFLCAKFKYPRLRKMNCDEKTA